MSPEELDALVRRVQAGDKNGFSDVFAATRKEVRIFLSAHASSADMVDEVLQAVSSAPSAAAGEPSFRSTFAVDVNGAGLGISSAGELFVDNVNHAQSGHVRAPGVGTVELRQVGDQVYVRIPPNRVPCGVAVGKGCPEGLPAAEERDEVAGEGRLVQPHAGLEGKGR